MDYALVLPLLLIVISGGSLVHGGVVVTNHNSHGPLIEQRLVSMVEGRYTVAATMEKPTRNAPYFILRSTLSSGYLPPPPAGGGGPTAAT